MQQDSLFSKDGTALDDKYVQGIVTRVVTGNADTGWTVFRFSDLNKGGKKRVKQRIFGKPVEDDTLVCVYPEVAEGLEFVARGEWKKHDSFGEQFVAESIEFRPPSSKNGAIALLSSGIIPGVGESVAQKVVEALGDNALEIIYNHPERLKGIPGIGPKKAAAIAQGYREHHGSSEIMTFLMGHGITPKKAHKIYKQYGDLTMEQMRSNPYQIAEDIYGFGFLLADKIALALTDESGKKLVPFDSKFRLRSAIVHLLEEQQSNGHCAVKKSELVGLLSKMLCAGQVDIHYDKVMEALDEMILEGKVILDDINNEEFVFDPFLHKAEKYIAKKMVELSRGVAPWRGIQADEAIKWVMGETGIQLAESQQNAIRQVLKSKVTVITGGPGVGKTTVTNSILKIMAGKGVKFMLAAPTGMAAKRASNATGREALTVHRTLEFNAKGGFNRNGNNPLECDLLVLDETSMLDTNLMFSVLQALSPKTGLIIIGDIDQLPSVGPGKVLADIINSGAIPVVRLTEIFRQAKTSKIITGAHAINRGEAPEIDNTPSSDFKYIEVQDSEHAVKIIHKLLTDTLPNKYKYDPVKDVQLLCPMNVRGVTGAAEMNNKVKEWLNPLKYGESYMPFYDRKYKIGDKVIQRVNNYEKNVMNGDIGYIVGVDVDATHKGVIEVDYSGVLVHYSNDELDEINLASAITIHKSQGSEFPVVIMPILTEHFMMLKRNLLYTGATRAKKMLILVAQQKAVKMAVKNNQVLERYSKLAIWLANEVKKK